MLTGVVLGAVLLVSPGSSGAQRDAAIQSMNAGIRLFERGEKERAAKMLREAVSADPGYARAHLALAQFHLQQEALSDAKTWANSGLACEEVPTEVAGQLAYVLGRATLKESEQQPRDVDRQAMTRAAIDALTDAVEFSPDHYRAHYWLGLAHDRLAEPTAADVAYRACIAAEPRYAPCFVGLGFLYIDFGHPELGLEVLEEGVRINETQAAIWSGLGRAYRALSRPADAVEALKKARKIDPKAPDVLFRLGMAYADLRRRKEAVEALLLFLHNADDSVPEHLLRAANSTIARMQDVI